MDRIRKNIRILSLFIGATATAAMIFICVGDGNVTLPGGRITADIWRILTMALAGFTLAIMARTLLSLIKIRCDEDEDDLLMVVGRLLISFFLMTAFVGIQVFKTYGVEEITWKTPIACMLMLMILTSLVQLNGKLNRVVNRLSPGMAARFTITGITHDPERSNDLLKGV